MTKQRCRVLVLALTLCGAVGAQSTPDAQRFTAFAVNMGNSSTGHNSHLEIVIDRWSTAADRDALAAMYGERGTNAAFKMLQAQPRIGYIRVAGRLGTDIAFARQVLHSDGTRRVVIVIARQLSFSEVNRNAPTVDYPFTLVELHLGANSDGDGKMFVGAKIKPQRGHDQIDHEEYAAGAVLLRDVKGQTSDHGAD